MDLSKCNVAVTGAGGFIGSHLAELLAGRSAKVRAFVHYNGRGDWGMLELCPAGIHGQIDVTLGDIRDPFAVRTFLKRDVVFHLAALIAIPYSYVSPASYVETNVQGTLNVLEACRSEGVARLVHTSTSEVYGTALYTPIDEKHPLQAQSPYSASKIAADKLAESYFRAFNLPVVTCRPFNTFGPRQSARAIVPTIVSQALAGGAVRLGSLTPVRDMTFVRDTCEGFCALAQCDAALGQTVNLGTGTGHTIGDIVKEVGAALGRKLQVQTDPARLRPVNSEVHKLISDNSLCRQLTGWQPRYSLAQGLAEVIAYVRDNPHRYKTSTYNV